MNKNCTYIAIMEGKGLSFHMSSLISNTKGNTILQFMEIICQLIYRVSDKSWEIFKIGFERYMINLNSQRKK